MLQTNEKSEFKAVLKDDYIKKSPFLELVPVTLSYENGKVFVSASGKKQGSSAILNKLLDSVLMIVPQSVESLKQGDIVSVIEIPK